VGRSRGEKGLEEPFGFGRRGASQAAGVYHTPKAEGRLFLLIDLQGSTQLAKRLGSAR